LSEDLGGCGIEDKVSVSFYTAQHPDFWTFQSALHFTSRPIQSYTTSTFL